MVLFRFPQADGTAGKLRPALVIRRLPGPYDDWLVCMISSQLRHAIPGFDEVMSEDAPDFDGSGLKAASVIRVARVAVVHRARLLGAIGEVAAERLARIKTSLSSWIRGS